MPVTRRLPMQSFAEKKDTLEVYHRRYYTTTGFLAAVDTSQLRPTSAPAVIAIVTKTTIAWRRTSPE